MSKSFKEMLAGDELIRLFALGRIPHPVLIEMFGLAGQYAGFWLDSEHVELTTEQMVNAGLAARANDMDCFVRIPPIGYWRVTQCLETGMGGVMAAQIHTVEQAEEFVQWAKFAPRGVRDAKLPQPNLAKFVLQHPPAQSSALKIVFSKKNLFFIHTAFVRHGCR